MPALWNCEAARIGPALMMAPTMLAFLITPERVIPRLRARDVPHVIDAMIHAAAEVSLDRETVRQAVMDHGASSFFGFDRGVAIPHALIPGLEQPVGVFARLKPAQDFGAPDDIPADLVFLLLSPNADDPTHLRTLACVVRRLRDREIAARLRSAKDAEAIHAVLTSDTWRGAEEPQSYSGSPSAEI
jgi:PTS system nitrogen regulatory IIA component